MILLDVNPSRENTEMMFSAAGLSPWIRFRTTDFEVTRSMVARGMGYAILVQRPFADLSYEGKPLAVRPIHPAVAMCRSPWSGTAVSGFHGVPRHAGTCP